MPRPDRPAIGIAEFANANFFSENTLDNDQYPHPLSDNLPPSLWTTPYSYPIVFIADADGRWRLWQF